MASSSRKTVFLLAGRERKPVLVSTGKSAFGKVFPTAPRRSVRIRAQPANLCPIAPGGIPLCSLAA